MASYLPHGFVWVNILPLSPLGVHIYEGICIPWTVRNFFSCVEVWIGDAVCRAELIIMLGEVPRVIWLLNAVVRLIVL